MLLTPGLLTPGLLTPELVHYDATGRVQILRLHADGCLRGKTGERGLRSILP